MSRICGKDLVKGLLGMQRSWNRGRRYSKGRGGIPSQGKKAQMAAVGQRGVREERDRLGYSEQKQPRDTLKMSTFLRVTVVSVWGAHRHLGWLGDTAGLYIRWVTLE